ncbi:beta-xylosidase/alpha-l-arabinosidase [Glycomyces terrestris]|uniref:Glycosyl hydrolase n=1 Tax=Glycomyces terrestris TaxID=2493553 RepID=A0A426UUY2_9ACTN|nr:glycoside hydrolase family 3 N-terminal domain-containing protein [Glycomyces terrestris]RRR98145.1 glycosyl hydrolase [Glycomyces terrestris]
MTTDIAASAAPAAAGLRPWHDHRLSRAERAAALAAEMTLEEKAAQLVGLWVGADASGGDVAPHQSEMGKDAPSFDDVIASGLGQLTRPFGTRPVAPEPGAASLARAQRQITAANRFGIPAQVHEECLAGFAAWGATAYPVPLSWGASFDPDLVHEMAVRIGRSMRAVGVHQGLAPVLDVVRDYRWGRVEESIGEDPYLVATVGASYVAGLEDAGIVATLKHFAGYSGSRAGRNHAPVSAGPRELAEIYLPPFETALRHGRARSVMNSYAEVDGMPAAGDRGLLTDLLRGTLGFEGVVVSDYFSVAFLRTLQRVAGTDAEAAARALWAGIDVELPSVAAFGAPLIEAVRSGEVDEALVDLALRRVLEQKIDLGLIEADYDPAPALDAALDDAESQRLALRLAREAVVLVANDGVLPLAADARVAVVGPLADDPMAMLGCYSFPAHVGVHHPETGLGIDIPTVLGELSARRTVVATAPGCDVMAPGRDGFAAAVEAASGADAVVVALGDRAGLFGRGTSGEGCDAPDLRLPGEQQALLEALLDTGTPVVLVLLTGRPYALGAVADRCAAVVQAFFPGQLGGQALAEVLAGEVNPSGRLPVGIPREPGGQPGTYLAPPLGRANEVSNLDPTPLFPFGHGLSYAAATWHPVEADERDWPVDGTTEVAVALSNETGDRVDDVVQVYLHDPVAQVTRPEHRLVAYRRVSLAAGERAEVRFRLHADLASFIGIDGDRIIEPGAVELRVARSSADVHAAVPRRMTGPVRRVGADRVLLAESEVRESAA